MGSLRTWVGTAASLGLAAGLFVSQAVFGQAPEPRRSLLDYMERQPIQREAATPAEPTPLTELSPIPLVLPATPTPIMQVSAISGPGDKKSAAPAQPDAKQVTTLPPVDNEPTTLPPVDAKPAAQPSVNGKPTTLPTDVVYEGVVVEEPKSAWLDHPKVRLAPRPGWFIIQPKGCGYYSLADCVKGVARKEAEKSGYPPFALMAPSFFDADFRYIDDPARTDYDHFDPWHRIHLGDNWLFGTGGQAWIRGVNEINSRLTGKDNAYDLARGRIYGDLWYKDQFRIFGEFISAWSFNQSLPPLAIDQNRADIQNLFIDVKLGEFNCNPFYLRVGRQELNFGSQRLVSTLDWANTRRTFQGARFLFQSEKFDFDAFWTRPIIPQATRFDIWDTNQSFAGAWATYRPKKGQVFDLYWLYLDNDNTVTAKTLALSPTSVHTFGSRYAGDANNFLWDFEGMYQGGDRGGSAIHAGNVTGGLGYHFKDAPMHPIFWAYYDWASGDSSPNKGDYNTFNQLFPFGHYYFGFADLVARQNVRDWSLHTYFFPSKWITCNAQYHFMQLDKASDALYSAGGAVLREAPKGNAGGNIGQELDLTVNFHLTRHSDLLLGYSMLQAGDFIRNTGPGRNPETTYFIYTFRW